ncbi:MAG: hypothetical protein JNL08_00820 [Planctomycetes bacterium]|nr:hypothetical protein [Planctomycetota bacterium]
MTTQEPDSLPSLPALAVAAIPDSTWEIASPLLGLPATGRGKTCDVEEDAAFRSKKEVIEFASFLQELGNELGGEALMEAANELAFDTSKWGAKLSSHDLAANFYVASRHRRDERAGAVVLCARCRHLEHRQARASIELRGRHHAALDGDLEPRLEQLRQALSEHFVTQQFGSVVEIEHFAEGGFLRIYVGRGKRYAKPLTIDESATTRARSFIQFRPAACDQLIFDRKNQILRVVTNPARLAVRYAQLFGKAMFDDEQHFQEKPTCTLDHLKQAQSLPTPPLTLPIASVAVVRSQLRVGDDKIEARRLPRPYFEQFPEAVLVEVDLRFHFRDGQSRDVRVRPPNRVQYVQDSRAEIVERYLDAAGFRGAAPAARPDLWSLPTGPGPIQLYRDVFVRALDDLVDRQVIARRPLTVVDGGSSGRLLAVPIEEQIYYGVPATEDGSARALTSSDLDGLELDPASFARMVADSVAANGGTGAIDDGRVVDLGETRLFGAPIRVFLVLREPAKAAATMLTIALDRVSPGIRKVVLVPAGRMTDLGVIVAQITDWSDAREIRTKIASATGTTSTLPVRDRAPAGTRLLIEKTRGTVELDGIPIDFDPEEQAFRLLLALAEAAPNPIATKNLDRNLSQGRGDDATTRQAKGRLKAKLEKAGVPADTVKSLFRQETGMLGIAISSCVA